MGNYAGCPDDRSVLDNSVVDTALRRHRYSEGDRALIPLCLL
jgi:hypothetical protein